MAYSSVPFENSGLGYIQLSATQPLHVDKRIQ